MNKYYRLWICGFLGLFLMVGAGPFAMAAPKDKRIFKNHVAFQKKPRHMENSLIRPKASYKQKYHQNTAREAVKSGRIVSLSVIRRQVRQSFPGKIVDVRLQKPKSKGRPYIYQVKLLRKNGKLLELKINAANARIVSVKGNK